MIYYHEGGDTKNLLFYFVGGGACMGTDLASTLESCYQRSKGEFGSSSKWPDTYDGTDGGLLAVDSAKSMFANWTKIVIMYCDGAFHQGNNKSPIKYKDTQLYFRGAVNTRSHIKWADSRYKLADAERIVVSGSSAGGIASYLWVDYFRTLVPNPRVVYGVVDSGIFYDPLVNRQLTIEQNAEYLGEMFARSERKLLRNEDAEVKADPNPI
jgi:O-palmitoleoyl-L-serine hydrolase